MACSVLDARRERVDVVCDRFHVIPFANAYLPDGVGPFFEFRGIVHVGSSISEEWVERIAAGEPVIINRERECKADYKTNRWRVFGASHGSVRYGDFHSSTNRTYGVWLLEKQWPMPTVDAMDFRWAYFEEIIPLDEEGAAWLAELALRTGK